MNNAVSALVITLIILGLSGILFILILYLRDIQKAQKRIKDLGAQIINTNLGPIECVIIGKGSPVLIIHGAIGGFDQGLFLAHNIDLNHHQAICISRFGFLGTPTPPDATLDLQADMYAALMDALEIRQIAVFAASAGSTSAIRFAARHPHRVWALVLLSPDAPGDEYMSLPHRFVFDILFRSDFFYWVMITFFRKQVRTAFGLIPKGYPLTKQDADLVDKVLITDLPSSRRMDGTIFETYAYEDEFKSFLTPSNPYPLRKIDTPVLIINAADDPISLPGNVRAMAELLPEARLFLVPDGGHLLFGHREETKTEISNFLRKYEVGSRASDQVIKVN